jgi:uncharacterized membrane protein YbhN (UPF0104 family)
VPVLRRLRKDPVALSAFATLIAGIAVVAIAHATKVDEIGRAFSDFRPGWIGLIAGGEVLAYVGYMVAYRSIAMIHGHAPLALPLIARVVVAGFGPFTIGGGFGIDKRVLHALHEDEDSARVRVLALGVLEWAVLAPLACIVSIVLLAQGADVMASLLWPWAIAVPVGFALGLWATTPARRERLSQRRFMQRKWLAHVLEGVGVLHTLIRERRTYLGAWLGTALYWAADIAAFYGGVRAFGMHPGMGKVVIAYATGYAATRRSLPLGGAGVTEVLMTYSLYWVRQPLAPALAAVVAYRIFNLVLAAMPALIANRQLQPMLDPTS